MKRSSGMLALLLLALVACGGGGGEDDAQTLESGPATSDATSEAGSEASEASGEAAETDGGTSGASGETVKFGFLIGVTGDYSPYFEPSLAGAEIAIEEINAAGGVLGQQVELVTADNLSTVEGAVQGFSRLVDVDGVVAIGGVESDGSLAILDTLKERQIPVMCPACGTGELDEAGGDFIWRITGSDTDGGLIAAQFARDAGYQRVGQLVQNTEGASAPAEIFTDTFTGAVGGEITEEVRFEPGAATYQAEVQQAFAGDPDAVYVAAGFEAGTVIFREWERRGYGGTFFVSPDLVVPEIAQLTEALADGVAVGAIPAYDESSQAYESFAQRYEERTGEPPSAGLYEANQYDQYIALALAITAADSREGPAIAEQVAEVLNAPGTEVFSYEDGLAALEAGDDIDLHGASSSLDVNEFGNLASPVFGEQQIQDGEWTQVRTIELDESLRG